MSLSLLVSVSSFEAIPVCSFCFQLYKTNRQRWTLLGWRGKLFVCHIYWHIESRCGSCLFLEEYSVFMQTVRGPKVSRRKRQSLSGVGCIREAAAHLSALLMIFCWSLVGKRGRVQAQELKLQLDFPKLECVNNRSYKSWSQLPSIRLSCTNEWLGTQIQTFLPKRITANQPVALTNLSTCVLICKNHILQNKQVIDVAKA